MGTGIYKGGATYQHSMSDNVSNIKTFYPLHNGYFGNQGDSSKGNIRHIESENPLAAATDFYDQIAHGAIEKKLPNGKGKVAKMEDGAIITIRPVSSSDGSPAVDINIKNSKNSGGIKGQKIHFVKKGKK